MKRQFIITSAVLVVGVGIAAGLLYINIRVTMPEAIVKLFLDEHFTAKLSHCVDVSHNVYKFDASDSDWLEISYYDKSGKFLMRTYGAPGYEEAHGDYQFDATHLYCIEQQTEGLIQKYWPTYTNNEYGFSIQYPSYNEAEKYNYQDEYYRGIVLISMSGGLREHSTYVVYAIKDTNSTFASVRQKVLKESPQTTFEELSVGGYTALLAHEPEGINGIEALYFQTPKGMLMLSGSPPSDTDKVIRTLKKL